MYVASGAAITFNGNSNVMKSNTAPENKGKNIYSSSRSNNIEFSVCKPGTTSPGTLSILELDFDGCPHSKSCADGYWKFTTGTADVCTGCRSACGAGTRETTPCSSAANRRCTQNTCSCSNGVKATGTTCTTHNTNICTSCSSGYTKSDNTCNANTCAPTRVANSNKAASNSIEGTISNYINICCFIL